MECEKCGHIFSHEDPECPACNAPIDSPIDSKLSGLYEEDLLSMYADAKWYRIDSPSKVMAIVLIVVVIMYLAVRYSTGGDRQFKQLIADDAARSAALIQAVSTDNTNGVKTLIAAGADVNAKTKDGAPVLMVAVMKNNVDCVKALVAAGADVNATVKDGVTNLMLARSSDVSDILRQAGEMR